MYKSILLVILFLWVSVACNRKQYICPAYNTYFIHDNDERLKMFMPFIIDSLGEDLSVNNTMGYDTTQSGYGAENVTTAKFHPKSIQNQPQKLQPKTGLVINSSKKKMRNANEIEMKTIKVKPLAKYSNADSTTAMPIDRAPEENVAPQDTL
ncbi:MAG: hypothetical protein NW207_06865 [Cytophagales bacterium]|nr:hypothetical protein [Cytophagales bacterium]